MHRVRVALNGISGAPYLATHYFGSTDPLQTAQEAVEVVGNFWAAVDLHMSSGVTWNTEAEVAEINIATGDLEGITATTPRTGSGGAIAAIMPPATQGLIRWRTGVFVAGREVRGRTFVPGLTTSAASAGKPSATVITDFNAAAAAMVADPNADLYVWSRKNGVIGNVVTGTAWNEFAVLRSRRD